MSGPQTTAGKEWVESGVRGMLGDSVVDEMGKEYEKASDLVWSKYGETERLGMDFVTMFTPEGGVVIPAKVVVLGGGVVKAASLGGSIVKAAKTVPKVSALGKIDFKYWAKHKVGDVVQDARGDSFTIVKNSKGVVVRASSAGDAIAIERSAGSLASELINAKALALSKIKQKIISDEQSALNGLKGHGHASHVKVTDSDLQARLSKSPKLNVVSRFDSHDEYLDTVSSSIYASRFEIDQWVKDLQAGNFSPKTMVLNSEVGFPVGKVITKGQSATSQGSCVKVVLKYNSASSDGYTIITGFPF